MNKTFSGYLNFLRAFAAVTVVVSHIPFSEKVHLFAERRDIGYDAVILFFVLSGYVISFAADKIEKDAFNYFISRFCRIFPVALVSILIAFFLATISQNQSPDLYPEFNNPREIIRNDFLSLFFLNQFWWNDIRPFNLPQYWSLSYEVWDYILYGLIIFTKGRLRILSIVALLVLNGPKFILLLPPWIFGAIAYHCRDRVKMKSVYCLTLAAFCLLVYLAIKINYSGPWSYYLIGQKIEGLMGHGLDGAARFLWAWILGLIISIHLWALEHSKLDFRIPSLKFIPIAANWAAGISFSLYLLHGPLAMFWKAYTKQDHMASISGVCAIYLCMTVPTILVAQQVEYRKGQFKKLLISFKK